MVNHTYQHSKSSTFEDSLYDQNETESVNSEVGPFLWDETTQGLILSSYYWGYLISQIPGGRISEIFSAKWAIFTAVFLNIIGTLLTPLAAEVEYLLMLLRSIEGVGAGCSFPALSVLLSKWAPTEERDTMTNIVYAGAALGTVLSILFSGYIYKWQGWEAVFYWMGCTPAVWCLLWIWLVADDPTKQRYITEKERILIQNSLGVSHPSHTAFPVPWKKVCTSVPFVVIMITHFCNNFCWYLLVTELPKYFSQILSFNIEENSHLLSVPYFTLWIFALILGKCLDIGRTRKLITTTTARKISTFFASVVPAACLLAVTFVVHNHTAVLAAVFIAVTAMGGMFSGVYSNNMDIAPQYAGTLLGITNTFGTIPGIIVPIFVGEITQTNKTEEQWNIIFYTTVGILVFEAVVYLIFGSGEEQSWNRPNDRMTPAGFVKIRYVFAILGFILMAIVYGLKVNLSVAIVGMRNYTAEKSGPINITQSDCPAQMRGNTTIKDGPFEWGEEVKGVILSSYFFGYLVSQVPGGRAAEVFSAKWILFASVVLNIVPTVFTPPAALLHWSLLVVLRIIEGVGGGFSFPALHVMISKWAPVEERSLISSIIYAGTAVGTVLSLLFTGLIVQYINWEAVFYIMGGLSSIWCLLWWLIMTDSPRTNPYISDEERDYIASSLGQGDEEITQKKLSVPWKHVWTSLPFYAILLSHVFSNFGWYMLLIETPIYYDQVLKLTINMITIYSSLPFFTLWLYSLLLSGYQSKLITRKSITVTTARKISTFLASAVPAVCLVAVNFLQCHESLIFAFMAVGTTLMGGMFSGFLSNHIDIAPQFAGTLMGITNTVATIPGIIVPIIVGQLTKTNHTREQWSIVLHSAAAFLVLEAVVYTVFGSGQEQPWSKPDVANVSKDVEVEDAAKDANEETNM